jgi:polyisoprenoid-binding protein YceI
MFFRTSQIAALTIAAASLTAGPARAADTYRVSGGEVVVVCPLTIGGSFEARTKNVQGEVVPSPQQPGNVAGTLRVDLQTLETGIGLRDRHMRENYLEVKKGPDFAVATIEEIRIERLDGKTTFNGTLRLHGQKKAVSGTAELRQQGDRIRVQAQFPISVSNFAIPKPAYLGVGVADEIEVKVTMMVEVAPAATTGRR